MTYAIFISGFAFVWLTYFFGGGNFERGPDLAAAFVCSVILAVGSAGIYSKVRDMP